MNKGNLLIACLLSILLVFAFGLVSCDDGFLSGEDIAKCPSVAEADDDNVFNSNSAPDLDFGE